jgi:carboxyl-terminal processing protease
MLRPFLLTLLICSTTFSSHAEEIVKGQAQVAPSRLPLEELRTFAEIYERIRSSYVEEVDDKDLLENAIHGMLGGLDPHSSYMGADDFNDLKNSTSGKFGGLGIEVGIEDGFIKVVSPIDDTPASKAGIQAGDLIIKLDDTLVKGIGLNKAVEKMRGDPGSPIIITIMREGEIKPLVFNLKRAHIKITSVKHKLLQDHFGYVRITQFQENTGSDIHTAISTLMTQSQQSLQGIVLDLRNNPGGVLDAAVAVSDVFIEQGLIVYTQGRVANADVRYEATVDTLVPEIPVIVLINGGSASASEIVAGALQDHGRAVIMGTLSFGKGSVQTVLPLNGDHALKLTTARYYTPKGRSIQAKGITPDIKVEQGSFTPITDSRYYKESDLKGHLENPKETEDAEPTDDPAKDQKEFVNKDYQLQQALLVLKGMNVLTPKPLASHVPETATTDEQADEIPAESAGT